MRKLLLIFGLLAVLGLPARAQFTPITAQVQAPNGPYYVFGTGSANISCPGNQQPTFNGYTLQRSITITGLDGFGTFSMKLYDVNAIQPTGCSWTFSITDQTGVYSFTTGQIGGATQSPVITGGSVVNLSAAISAYAVPLPTSGPGGTVNVNGVPVTNPNFQTSATVTYSVSGSNVQAISSPISVNGTQVPGGNLQNSATATLSVSGTNIQINATPSLNSNVAFKPGASGPIIFACPVAVCPNSSDTNDGLSWGSAKATIYGAWTALPNTGCNSGNNICGGTIYITSSVTFGGPVSGQGLWICGASNPNFPNCPNGWVKEIPVTIQCAGPSEWDSQSVMPQCLVIGESGTVPALQISGSNDPMDFIGLKFLSGSGSVIAKDSNGVFENSAGTSQKHFYNCAFGFDNAINTNGPGLRMGPNSFENYFDYPVFDGNPNAAGGSAARQAFVLDPGSTSNNNSGTVFVTNGHTNTGGLEINPDGQGSAGAKIDGLLCEGQTDSKGCVWITTTTVSTSFHLAGIWTADSSPINQAVEVDGNGPPDAVNVITPIGGGVGVGTAVSGPAIVTGNTPGTLQSAVVSPDKQHQNGFASGRVLGQTDAARRGFPPTAVRFVNLAATSPGSWTTGGGGVITTGITAPDGTTGAGECNSTSGAADCYFYNANQTYAIGDIVVIGAWAQAQNAVGFNSNQAISISTPSCGSCLFVDISGQGTPASSAFVASYLKGDGSSGAPSAEWEWYWKVLKVTGTSGAAAQTQFIANVQPGYPANYYGPMFLHIAANAISDNEATELGLNLQPYNNSCSVGSLCGVLEGGTVTHTGPLGQGNPTTGSGVSANDIESIPNYFDAFTFAGSTLDVQLNACSAAALTPTGGGGTCDASSILTTAANPPGSIIIGDNAEDQETFVAPNTGVWTTQITDGSSCGMEAYAGSSIINNAPGGGPAFLFQGGGGTGSGGSGAPGQFGYVFCTNGGTGTNPYYKINAGIRFRNVSPYGSVTANNVGGHISNFEDNAFFGNLEFFDTLDNFALEVENGCCSGQLFNVNANADYGSTATQGGTVPIFFHAYSGDHSRGINSFSGSFDHHGPGLPAVEIIDADTNNEMTNNFFGTYTETGNTSTPSNEVSIAGARMENFFGYTFASEAANNTSTGFNVTTGYSGTCLNVNGASFVPASQNWTYPVTAVLNQNTGHVALTDVVGNIARYTGTCPAYDENLRVLNNMETLDNTSSPNASVYTTWATQSSSGANITDISPQTAANEQAQIRIFRSTNVGTATACVDVLTGQNVTTINDQICGTGNSYLGANNGSLTVGSSAACTATWIFCIGSGGGKLLADTSGDLSLAGNISVGQGGPGEHVNTYSSSNDVVGTISTSSSTTNTITFTTAFNNTPICTLGQAEVVAGTIPATGAFAYIATATTLRIDVTNSGTWHFSYHCFGAPN